jgi:hypothetical protein
MHVPVLCQTGACCHDAAVFDKPASHICDLSVAICDRAASPFAIAQRRHLRSRGVVISR